MALPKDVQGAVDSLECEIADPEDCTAWQTIRAHLLSQDAEIERLQSGIAKHVNSVCDLQSRLAAADALLRECLRYLNPHHYPDTIKRIDAHLSENTHG